MLGTLKFSSRVQYGRNKKNIPYYQFEPANYQDTKIVVASKKGQTTKIDHYVSIDIIDNQSNPNKGALINIIGPINDYDSNKNYILQKSNISKKNNIICLTSKNENLYFENNFTYSIDPLNSKDIDDAFSYDFDNKILYIHITDLSELKIENFEDLINKSFTFYDDEYNINMLPNEISENECSLIENQLRNVISLQINIENKTYKFIKMQIKVCKNLTYEDADSNFENEAKWIDMKNNIQSMIGQFNDSHEFIQNLMIFYNSRFYEILEKKTENYPIRIHKGIKDEKIMNANISDFIKKKICYYAAEYVNNAVSDEKIHYDLNISKYTHATSPLRRAIDIINQKIAFGNLNENIYQCCNIINERNNAFKKAYNQIKLLNLINDSDNNNKIFEGIVIGFDDFRIKVYIEELDIVKLIDLFFNSASRIFVVHGEGNHITIVHRSTKERVVIKLYQKVKLLSLIKSYDSKLYKKLKFFIKEPDLISLLD